MVSGIPELKIGFAILQVLGARFSYRSQVPHLTEKNMKSNLFVRRIAAIAVMSALVLMASFGVGTFAPLNHGTVFAQGAQPSIFPNFRYAPLTATATSQTVKAPMGGVSSCLIQQTSVANTTITWQIKFSMDGGTTYYALSMAPYATSLTQSTAAITTTSTAAALFVANMADITNIELVTSGTFTATSLTVQLTCSGNKGLL
jgi:hypothetical protein